MLKKTITYTDFNGVERTEDFYFNLTQAEIMELQLGTSGGLDSILKQIIESKDEASIIDYFKKIVLKAYGIKSSDGRSFRKSDEIKQDFQGSEAYSKIFMELAFDANKAAEFVNGIMPKDLDAKVNDEIAKKLEEIKSAN